MNHVEMVCRVVGCLVERHKARLANRQTEGFVGVAGSHDSNISERKFTQVLCGILDDGLMPFAVVDPAVVFDDLDSIEA